MPFATPALDMAFLHFANQTARCALFDWLMPLISSRAVLFTLLPAAAAWEVWRRGWKRLILFAVLLAGMAVTDSSLNPIKDAVGRVRPLNAVAGTYYHEDGQWRRLPATFVQTKEHGSSYPSAHAANTMCLAVLGLLLWRSRKPWILLLPLAVGYSRLYLGKHYPVDVFMGWLYGLAVAGFVWLAWEWWLRERVFGYSKSIS